MSDKIRVTLNTLRPTCSGMMYDVRDDETWASQCALSPGHEPPCKFSLWFNTDAKVTVSFRRPSRT